MSAIHFCKMNVIKGMLFGLFFMILSAPVSAQWTWPGLTEEMWRNMSTELLEVHLAYNEVNERDAFSYTPLMHAADFNTNPDIVEMILQKGADVGAPDRDGNTALMWAAMNNPNPEVIRVLMNYGADLSVTNDEGWTARSIAKEYNNSEVSDLFKSAPGRTPAVSDNDGQDFFGDSETGSTAATHRLSAEEEKLYRMIMEYRASLGLPSIPLSRSLSFVARVHSEDLTYHERNSGCNMHSWSDNGPWTGGCYTSDHSNARIMWDKPRELTDYPGNGYEISHMHSAGATAESSLNGWKSSPGHHNVIINSGIWERDWNAIGIGIYGNYSNVWFGRDVDPLD